jgi:hypothetical protein
MDISSRENESWGMCCSSVYKAEVVFFSQIIFLMTILLFSIVQIVKKAETPEIYFSLICTVLGIVIPQPRLNDRTPTPAVARV